MGLAGGSETYRSGALINWEHPPISAESEQRTTIRFRTTLNPLGAECDAQSSLLAKH